MRILVADGNPANLESARRTLAGHDLVLVDTPEAAAEILFRQSEAMPHEVSVSQQFDVVLLSLYDEKQSEKKMFNEAPPVGFSLALTAASRRVAPLIGMVAGYLYSYDHPFGEPIKLLFDRRWSDGSRGVVINGTRVTFSDHVITQGYHDGRECEFCAHFRRIRPDCPTCQGVGKYVRAKNWGRALTRLLGKE